jgi:hypothetical protein
MTRIVMHPPQAHPYGAPVMMMAPWAWWETHIRAEGTSLQMHYDPDAIDIREFSVTFGLDEDRVALIDPPSMHLIHTHEFDDLYSELGARRVTTRADLTARVVWWCPPGEAWRPVEHVRTCSPGRYEHESHTGDRAHRVPEDWDNPGVLYESMSLLNWPMNPMIVDGMSIGPPTDYVGGVDDNRRLNREEIASIYGLDPALLAHPGRREIVHRVLGPGDEARDYTLADIEAMRGGFEAALAAAIPTALRALGFDLEVVAPGLVTGIHTEEMHRYGPAIKPERDVIDEIDRLVNEQIRPGPRDDYTVDRYPRCDHCQHSWHGKPCDECACLGEFEAPV